MNSISQLLLSDECIDIMFKQQNLLYMPCIKQIIAKLLSYGILAGSVLFKLPQILSIISAKKVDGISFFSFYCELPTVMLLIAYNYLQNNPFLSYGENIFVCFQNFILVGLLWTYMKPRPSIGYMLLLSSGFGLLTALAFNTPPEYRYLLPLTTPPLVFLSRFSQVYVNYQNKSTGTLSLITTLLALAGAIARFFTTVQQVGWDYGLLSGIFVTAAITSILALQFLLYSGNKSTSNKPQKQEKKESKKQK